MVLDGVTYTLEQDEDDPSSFEFENENTFVDLTALIASTDIGGNDDAVAVSLFAVRDGTLDSGRLVLGFDTDPATIDKLDGSAEFTGRMDAVLRNGFAASLGRGDVTFTVDFDDNMVDGNGVLLGDPEDQDVQIESIAITFDPTSLDENNFTGTISIPDGDIAGPLAEGEYNGRLFGPDGETIGGTFTGRIILEDFEQDTFIDGVFLGVD